MRAAKALALMSVLALSGCQAASEPEAVPAPSQSETQEQETETQPTRQPEPAGPQECKEATQLAIEGSIDTQTAAFGLGEFERAYSIASPSFQSNVTLDGFIEIISESYGPLIGTSELAYRDCMVDSSETIAVIDVRFIESGNSVYGLRYLMVSVDGSWRVDGASNLQVVGEGT